MMDLDDMINDALDLNKNYYIKCGKDIIQIKGFFYESSYEFFNNAIEISVNNSLLYKGYKEYGIDKKIYISGKEKNLEDLIIKLKNMLIGKEYTTHIGLYKNKDYER